MRPIHRPRRWTFEVDALRIVAAAVAWTLELIFAGFPIRRAAQVRADGRDHEDSLRVADHPDAVRVLEFGVDAKTEVGWIADRERSFGLEKSARKEEAQEHHQIHGQESQNRGHDKTATPGDLLTFVGIVRAGENLADRFTDPRFNWLGRRRGSAGRFFSGWIR